MPTTKSTTTTQMVPSVRDAGLRENKDLSHLIGYAPWEQSSARNSQALSYSASLSLTPFREQHLCYPHAMPIVVQLCMGWREGCWRKVCKSCKMASTSSRLAPHLASMTLSSHSWSSVVNAAANTVISSSESSRVSNRTLATSFSAILFAMASPVCVPESSVLIGHVVADSGWWYESWCGVSHWV